MSPKREKEVVEGANPPETVAADAEDAAKIAEPEPEAKPKRAPRRRRKQAEPEAAATEATAEAKPAEDADEASEAKEKPKRSRARAKPAEKPEEPAPAPKRRAREPGAAPAIVHARAKYVRTSARKARLVSDHIRGKSVQDARAILAFAPRAAARDWSKLLESAVANAEHNHELVGDELTIKDIHADEGPTLKRYRPRAMGRATRIRKRTAHLSITLTPEQN
jgi:large subunit ribosomal protein L22